MLARTLGSKRGGGGGGVDCEIPVGEENETFFIRVWKPLPSRHVLKTEGKLERESPKRTISASGELGQLTPTDMVFKLIFIVSLYWAASMFFNM